MSQGKRKKRQTEVCLPCLLGCCATCTALTEAHQLSRGIQVPGPVCDHDCTNGPVPKAPAGSRRT